MTTLSPARDGQPVLHVQIDQYLTREEFCTFWMHRMQEFNDAEYEITDSPELGEDE